MSIAGTIIVTVLGSTAIASLVQFLITRHDQKKNIKGKLDNLERDVLRSQLLLLILMKPEERQEIMTVAQHYFGDLHGNWYMTSIFNGWITEHDIAQPEWFSREG